MIKLSEDSKELCELRHTRSALEIFGKGIFIFTVWSTIRNTMYIFLEGGSMSYLAAEIEATGYDTFVYMCVFYGIIFADMIIRFFTARAAVRDARGKKKHKIRVYVAVCLCMQLVSVYGNSLTFSGESLYTTPFDKAVTVLLGLADFYTVAAVMYYSHKLKKLTKMTAGEVK